MRLPRPLRPRRLVVIPVALAATMAVVPPVVAPAAAAPAGFQATRPVAPTTITLITGDTVTFSKDAAGRASVNVQLRPGNDALTYTTEQSGDKYFLIPDEAAPQVASGLLDRQLFDLNYLAVNGYGDDRTKAVPVIVQYHQKLTATQLDLEAGTIPGNTDRRTLPSINGAALEVGKDQARAFWEKVRGPAANTLGAGLTKVWLDAKVKALDDVSNAQIGAPTAWAAGYDGTGATVGVIDSGVDATHPDLAGRIAVARNFVEAGSPGGGNPEDVTDRHGHGTHVASTVAGSGAASNGRYKGAAPGAKLSIAKALDDAGYGTNSAIIAAMEWQVTTGHADVVSMSLGGGPTDGTDPLSQAVNELTARYGTLFVIAAGNAGPGQFTVAAPGAASSALTVGAVDANDRMADFSSRGPRVGDLAIKPEITAPGVGIVAARAAGTKMGQPLNDRYTAASGTSMATPHVAAAAGILAAKHADWTPEQLKAALVGTAKDGGFSVYEQGSGRLDIGRAVTQPVVDDVAAVSARVTYPYEGQALTKTVNYRNTGSAPVALDLSVKLTHNGSAAPAGMAKVSRPSLTVEPGATASIDVTLDPTVAQAGWYDGKLTATGGTSTLTVPIALWLQAEQDTVTVQLVGDPGWLNMTSTFVNAVLLSDTDIRFAGEPSTRVMNWKATGKPNTLEAKISLARGATYSLSSSLFWSKADRQIQYGLLFEPEFTVDGAGTVVLDATKMARVDIGTQQPSEAVIASYFHYRSSAAGQLYTGGSVFGYPAVAPGGFWVSPTKKTARIGMVGFIADQTRIAPQVTLTVPGYSLHPRYVSDRHELVPKFDRDRLAGFASEQDLRGGKDVRGKLVFLTPAPLQTFLADMDSAIAQGAAGVLTNNHLAWVMHADAYVKHMKIPLLWLDSAEAAQLARQLPRWPAVLQAKPTTPYEYKAVYYLRDRIPDRINLFSYDRDTAQVDTTYHARFTPKQGKWGPVSAFTEVQHTFIPGQTLSIRASHEFTAPDTRTEYYTVPGNDVLWSRAYRFTDPASGASRHGTSSRGFTRGAKETEDWNEAVLPMQALSGKDTPANGLALYACDNCRQGDRLRLRSLSPVGIGQFADASDPNHQYTGEPGTEEVRLYRDGKEVPPEYDSFGARYHSVPADAGTYRLTDVYTNGFGAPHGATTVTTDWTFRSSRPAASTVSDPYTCVDTALFNDKQPCAWQPLIQLAYQLDVAGDDTTRAGRPFTFTMTARTSSAKPIALRDLRVWTSADGGKNWTKALVTRWTGNAHYVSVINPRNAGPVTIKAEATDRDGNSVSQVIVDAYQVK
ncbi:subtilisin family serine protease [Kibdelosporangium banguiense]|uniref:Subtilisin family serine protease n=1 Tax=Kibdelosporangium banguiense TaxID=1365924 RepID=A0ABS4TZ23_9PSEU|nr:S8 family serine peptidase [Kibdelosporangium banguiense]MBP2329668.1 subtilisin family serine protease [Kibdelosporangium banguiense]